MTRVSIRDVAAETGYSPATASTLNEKGNVGAKATHIILEAIARLGTAVRPVISRIIRDCARQRPHCRRKHLPGVYTGIERAVADLGCRRRW